MKRILKISAFILAMLFVLAGCNGNADDISVISGSDAHAENKENATEYEPELVTLTFTSSDGSVSEPETDEAGSVDETQIVSDSEVSFGRPKVKFTMENGGTFVIELYPEYAPETCANFVDLVSKGFYDGLTFHRVVEGFMAQGGDPEGTGRGGSDKNIHGEFYANGFTQNVISHTRGVVSMARSNSYDSASSQFFICYDDCSRSLDGGYAAFGLVTEGMETVDSFLDIERTYNGERKPSKPVTPIVIEKAEVIS